MDQGLDTGHQHAPTRTHPANGIPHETGHAGPGRGHGGAPRAHDHDISKGAAKFSLHPDTIKRCLEDALTGTIVSLLSATLPVALHQADDGQAALAIGNESGRQVVRCRTVSDATETALVARFAGGSLRQAPTGAAHFRRTLEFDWVEALDGAEVPVPEWLQIAKNRVRRGTAVESASPRSVRK